jgi:hypothetical protein
LIIVFVTLTTIEIGTKIDHKRNRSRATTQITRKNGEKNDDLELEAENIEKT